MNPTMKTMLWFTVLTLIVCGIGQALGGTQGLQLALIFAAIGNLVSYFFSDTIVLRMYNAQPIDETEAPGLHRIVDELALAAHIPKPRLYLIPSATPNAFATGRSPNHAAVAVTSGIMQLLSERQLKGVLAHELAHVLNRDVLLSSIVATMAGAICYLESWMRWSMIFGGYGGSDDDREGGHPLINLLILMVMGLVVTLLQLAISRSRELAADATGAHLSQAPMSLASALATIEQGVRMTPMDASPATAHLFIMNPIAPGQRMASLLSTHPPTEERIARLERIAQDMGTSN